MTVEEVKQETEILLKITGRIDTNTSTQLQAEVLKSLQKMPNLTLDLKECDYVSSAGLRTFLIAQKTASAKGRKVQIKKYMPGCRGYPEQIRIYKIHRNRGIR